MLLMLSDMINWSTAALGGTPFRLNKCTALGSAGKGAAAGGALGGAPGALIGGALGFAGDLIGGLLVSVILIRLTNGIIRSCKSRIALMLRKPRRRVNGKK